MLAVLFLWILSLLDFKGFPVFFLPALGTAESVSLPSEPQGSVRPGEEAMRARVHLTALHVFPPPPALSPASVLPCQQVVRTEWSWVVAAVAGAMGFAGPCRGVCMSLTPFFSQQKRGMLRVVV